VQYAALKRALAHYREVVTRGDWVPLPESFPGDPESNPDSATALRHRLALEDDTATNSKWASDSLKQFQARHGLPADGTTDRKTIAALNVSASERAMQIAANMERWRWLPRVLETSYVSVNVPDQHLTLIGPDGPVLVSRVIVGRPSDRTPIFRAVASSVTVNPPWNVPVAIAGREILPKLRNNPRYLIDHDMVLKDGPPGDPYGLHINWSAVSASTFRFHVQQHPGPKNALGSIKLELPNRFNVYLHYTSAQSLFGLDSRALSHGCVRVEQILPLASYALSGDPAAAVSSLKSAIASGKTEHLALRNRLPIYFLYWTAFADPDGTIQFRPDIYGRDQRLIAAIENRAASQRVTMNTTDCTPT
jgi:murein L,D-transpeptidase YcbB/YkuD